MSRRHGPGVTPDAPASAGADSGEAWMRHMRRGDFEAAWVLADRDRSCPPAADAFTRPRHLQRIWDGGPIDGRRVLVRCYHGLGDTIQFARFLPALSRRAASVVVWAQQALLPLLATIDAPLELLPLHDGVPAVDYDVDVEIMELAWVLRATLATLPGRVPYLHVPAVRRPDPGALTAVAVWRAGGWNPARSIAADAVAWLARVPGVTAFAIDPEPPATDVAAWPGQWAPHASLDALAGFLAGVDLVISVDTMCAHLAGALGVRVWTLLPRAADWRWLDDRDETPWYPTMRLFRQTTPGSWAAPLAALRGQLERAARSARERTAHPLTGTGEH